MGTMIVRLPHTTWEVDTERKRVRFLSHDVPFDAVTAARFGAVFDQALGVPSDASCLGRNAGVDGWAIYDKITKIEPGYPFSVRWPDGSLMMLPAIVAIEP